MPFRHEVIHPRNTRSGATFYVLFILRSTGTFHFSVTNDIVNMT
jgi:hypothetical protein